MSTLEDELSALGKRLDGFRAEKRVLDEQLVDLRPKLAAAQEALDTVRSQVESLQETVYREDDAVFADFCRHIGVNNIREYEERHMRLMQQQIDVRLEYEKQMKRLEHAIRFEEGQLASAEARRRTNENVIVKQKARMDELERERISLQAKLEEIRTHLDRMRSELEELQRNDAECNATLSTVKKDAADAQADLDEVLRMVATCNLQIEKLASERRAIYRRCRVEEIALPLQAGSLNKVPLQDESLDMDLDDEEDASQHAQSGPDYGIVVQFDDLTPQERRDGSDAMGQKLEESTESAVADLERILAPNTKAVERLGDSEARLADAEREYERAKRDAKRAQEDYLRLRKIRCDLYHRAFDHISGKVDEVYKDLTRSKTSLKGGNAYLDLQNDSEPYLEGVLYTAMPPTKSFRGIDQLSGGEKSIAALALLFAIHSYRPAPFFVLDEVDAALDAHNVARVASYIRSRASAEFQFIVISLKATLYEKSEALLGVMRDQGWHSSKTLTLDLEQYA